MHENADQENTLALLKGIAAASGLCVGVGYYTFKAAFRYCHGSMSLELWQANNLHRVGFPYWLFLCLDLAVHVWGVVYTAYKWGEISRLWRSHHIHHSPSLVSGAVQVEQYTIPKVHKVYGFKEMPTLEFRRVVPQKRLHWEAACISLVAPLLRTRVSKQVSS